MKRLLRYIKFNVVGAMGMVVQLVMLWLLHRVVPSHYLFATLFAVELAIVHNFLWHVRFTWRNRECDVDFAAQFCRFQLSNGAVSLVGNLVLTSVFVRVSGLPVVLANTLGIACCSIANFWLAEVWAFGQWPSGFLAKRRSG